MRTSNYPAHHAFLFTLSLAAAFCLTLGTSRALADSPDEHLLDQRGIDGLKAKAVQAAPRDQYFLFAQIVHQLAELSAQKYAQGETEQAIDAMRQIHDFAAKMNMQLTEHDKRLKNTEILLRHTAFRLREMLHSGNVDDQALVQQTLAQIDHLDADTLQQVFKK
jgi:hypothetical protein